MKFEFRIGQPYAFNDTDELIYLWIDDTGYKTVSIDSEIMGGIIDEIEAVHIDLAKRIVKTWMRHNSACTKLDSLDDLELVNETVSALCKKYPFMQTPLHFDIKDLHTLPTFAHQALYLAIWLKFRIKWAIENCELPSILYHTYKS